MKQKFILLDIDNTLFDAASYRNKFSEKICVELSRYGVLNPEVLCDEVYMQLRVAKGLFAPEEFVEALLTKTNLSSSYLQTFLDIIYSQKTLQNNLYSEVLDTLQLLQKYATIGIFSQGEDNLQKRKIDSIRHFFTDDHMHIVENKEKAIENVFLRYTGFETYFVDDALPILYKVHKEFPSIQTIWMKRGRYAKIQKDIVGFTPFASIVQLDELTTIIKEN
ncbi:MAG: HAD family hydrolase [Candidatus Levybacteria bacterium]|nr:HAD family hydrolase [Candidatus Levybacteria bacterium]